ncbi:pre-mRNA-splicing factor CWC2, putative [Entamoeba invadens IP1]|uniref:pre-mRNA-splicing factor CWC2, putative n=1 Tax=Entamoeba invadens IP1 TaxID=370355 RepID=UPI0002C3E127|nr:pre-mRNA-splicing factor CWC2, putative [Entamoeba invadens IP1]ELP93139.1 pre-mRNA-splicing factor CWC2, putative [Entamoeba invadens IP1]|eukprot:XP_004259910.1 pre-mRNA-splicing factor CWC2, putative [Entamoeba invadens IP1]
MNEKKEASSDYSYEPVLNKPARKQTDTYTPFTPNRSGDYNIWYNRYSGFEYKQSRGDRGNMTRCCVKTDAGTTKSQPNSPLCIHFALGKCFKGGECVYKHQLPQQEDENRLGATTDIFGRERHLTDREDMGGIGKFSKENRTLYVTGFKGNLPPQQIEEILRRHFAEWGELEYIRVLPVRNIAFVRYRMRGAAEFAKVAMGDQALDGDERLNVRWAFDDPNPIAKAVEEQAVAAQYVAQVKKVLAERREENELAIDAIPKKKEVTYDNPGVIGFKYSCTTTTIKRDGVKGKEKEVETKDEKAVGEKILQSKKGKYVANKYTGFMHPYSYGLFHPKQVELAKKDESDDSGEADIMKDVPKEPSTSAQQDKPSDTKEEKHEQK